MSKIKLMIEVEDEDELDWVVNRGCIMADRLRNAKRIEESEDAISRKAVLEVFGDVHPLDYNANGYVSKIQKLPPVNPQTDALDRIRAEISMNAYPIVHGVNNHELGMTLYGILQIIDKYRILQITNKGKEE